MPFDQITRNDDDVRDLEILRGARDLIRNPDCWCQHNMLKRFAGRDRYCAVGALAVTSMRMDQMNYLHLLQRLNKYLPRNCCFHIMDYNDHPSTTHVHILHVFDQAIAELEGTHNAI